MKKQITITQWDELTHDQKDTLCKAISMVNDWKVSIGDMIEFLGDDLNSILKSTAYTVQLEINEKLTAYRNEELCNALWTACVYKLDK